MNHTRHVRQAGSVIIAICSTLFALVFFAPSAFAVVNYMGGSSSAIPPQQRPTVVHTVVAGGMAAWQVALIAVGAALLTATVAVLMDRARSGRRKFGVSAA